MVLLLHPYIIPALSRKGEALRKPFLELREILKAIRKRLIT
jgi:hypothetical protein